jgi:RNA polymerase sigma-70 factor (ECF subfamily)
MAPRNTTIEEINGLVAQAQAGSTAAFDELVRRYRPRIYALALHVTGNESDADDIAQEVFLRAYRALRSYEGRGDFFSWIYRIALHLSFNERRARKRRTGASLDDPRVELGVAADAGGNPRRAAALRQIYGRLVAALDQLSPVLRATVILVCLQGLSHVQAARVLGTNTGTIGWRIHEARARLRVAMKPGPPGRLPPPPTSESKSGRLPPPSPGASVPRGERPVPTPELDSGSFDLSTLSSWYS